jgi:hypothetical protein
MTGDRDAHDLGVCQQCGNDDATHVLRLCLTCAESIPDPQADDEPTGILVVEIDDRDVDTLVRLGDYLARLYSDRED